MSKKKTTYRETGSARSVADGINIIGCGGRVLAPVLNSNGLDLSPVIEQNALVLRIRPENRSCISGTRLRLLSVERVHADDDFHSWHLDSVIQQ